MLNYIHISDEDLILLDGKCSEETQKLVNEAKERASTIKDFPEVEPQIAEFFADLKRLALKEGRLIYRAKLVTYCPVCEKQGGYAKFKSGKRKGESNFNKPLTFQGIEFEYSCVTFTNRFNFGCCMKCLKKVEPLLPKLAEVKAAIPKDITGVSSRFQWNQKRECTVCGWIGGENEMGRKDCLFDGTYPATCPKCYAVNKPLLDPVVKIAKGYILSEI